MLKHIDKIDMFFICKQVIIASMSAETDYRKLLKTYMQAINEREGFAYLTAWAISEEDEAELTKIYEEIVNEIVDEG